MFAIGYLASIIMGISLGLIGGGGSILTVPILFYFFQQDSLIATTNSLFIVGVTALIGALINAKNGNIDLKTGFIFALPSFAGVFVSRHFLLPYLPDILFSVFGMTLTKSLLVMISFAVLMVLASRAMIRSGGNLKKEAAEPRPVSPPLFSVAIKGFLVGCTTGFVGAGGGFLIIPALVLLLKIPMRLAIGTSLAIIAANSLFGYFISASNSVGTDWKVLIIISALGAVGIFAGHALSSKVPEKQLKKGFGFFVLLIGSLILIDQVVRMF
jgi:uncharacterized protein